MTTAYVQIQNAIAQATAQALEGGGTSVFENRLRPVAAGKNAVVVRLEQSSADRVVSGAKDHRTLYVIECYARTPAGLDPVTEVDKLLELIHPVLEGLDLSALAVMDSQLNAGTKWQFDDADAQLACAIVGFEVMHRTPANSLQPWT